MNKMTRMLTMAGMGIMATVAVGAGPAQASDATPQPSAKASAAESAKTPARHGGDQVVGYYGSLRACQLAGRIGERFDRWNDYDCDFIRVGFRRGTWVLSVERSWGWNRPGHGHWGPGGFGPGGFGPGGHGPRDHGPWNHGPRGPRR